MFGLGTQELLVIFFIALLLFGGKKLPEIGAGLGKALQSFKKGMKEAEDDTSQTAQASATKLDASSNEGSAKASATKEA